MNKLLICFCLFLTGCGNNLVQKRQEIFDKYNKIVAELFLKKCQNAQINIYPPNVFKCLELQNNGTYSYEILNNFFIISVIREQSLYNAGFLKHPSVHFSTILQLFKSTYFLPDGCVLRMLMEGEDPPFDIKKKPYFYEYFLNSPDKEIDDDLLKIGEDFKKETKELNNPNIAREFVEQNAILKTEYEISHHIGGNDINNLEKLKIFMNEKVAPETKEQLNKIADLNIKEIIRKYEEEDFKRRYNNSAGLLDLGDETHFDDVGYSNIEKLEENKNYIFLNRGRKYYACENGRDNEDKCDKTVNLDDNMTLISYDHRQQYILVKGKKELDDGLWDVLKYEGTRFVKEINKTVAFFTIIPDRTVIDYIEFIDVCVKCR